jgi:arabinan endo-1,5-alpha-L-arabinosidase
VVGLLRSLFFLMSILVVAEAPPQLLELSGDLMVHDPAIIKDGDTYYLFYTGGARGQGVVTIRRSPDM